MISSSLVQQVLSSAWVSSAWVGAVLALTVLVTVYYHVHRATTLRVPKGFSPIPGPPGIPIFGNTHQVPVANPQKLFRAWAKEYGELYQIQLGFQRWVFLNSGQAAKELIDKKSGLTSSRPPQRSAELVSGDMRILLMRYGEKWRKLRGIIHTMFTPKASALFMPSQEFEAKQMLHDMLGSRSDETAFYQHVRRYTTSVMLTSTYGFRVPVWDCEDVREIYGITTEFSEISSPVYGIIDVFPPILRLPKWMHWWESHYAKSRHRQDRLWLRLWNTMKQKIDQGVAPDCFGRQLVKTEYQKQGVDEIQAAYVAGSMIEAGSETTSGTFNSTILYLMHSPAVVKRAHEELQRVVGDHRSPAFDDQEALPYIRAMVKEILRLRPVASIGSPHFADADVVYKNFFIPKGTAITINQYAIHEYPQRWQNSDEFDPSRYLEYPLKAGQYVGLAHPDARDHWSFGGGRRACPGLHLAENSLFILCAKFLWAFDPRPPLDAEGREVIVEVDDDYFETGTTTLPKVFRCRLVPRNDTVVETLEAEWSKARAEGYDVGDKHVDENGIVVR